MDVIPTQHPSNQALESYGLGKLDEAAAEGVDQHLKQCSECQQRVAALSADSFLGRAREAQGAANSTFGQSLLNAAHHKKAANAPPPAESLPPGLAGNPDYTVTRELGRGGMGVVYLAHNHLMGRDEVLKVMARELMERPGLLDRFLREIRSVAKLRHPNIVTAYSATRLGESIVFAMEYIDGLDLARMVKAKGALPVGHACNFVYQAALGLQHAHEEGLVHRDIKPGNLMLSRKGTKATVKVLDFGLAKATREQKVDVGLTSVGQALGTPDFIAPEQILDAQTADIRADIYSLGGTLYYLLTGRPPFQADSLYDLYQAHISREADVLNVVRAEIPSELASVVAKMMAKEPKDRYQTPDEVARALSPFFKKASAVPPAAEAVAPPVQPRAHDEMPATGAPQEQLDETGEPESSINPAVDVSRRPRWVWPAVAVGVLMVGFAAIWLGVILRYKTAKGTIVIENAPEQGAIFVDGERKTITIATPGGPIELSVAAGEHMVEVKDGVKTLKAERITIEAGGKPFVVRLEPSDTVKTPDANDAAKTPVVNDGSVSLFNGKNLAGWRGFTSTFTFSWPEAFASVDHGELVFAADRPPGGITTPLSYRDYVLELDYQCAPGTTPPDPLLGAVAFALDDWDGLHRGGAVRCELAPGKAGTLRSWTGNNVFEGELEGDQVTVTRKVDAEKPAGEWNALEVRSDGQHLTIELNGQEINQVECNRPLCGPIGFLSLVDIRYRNIRISPVHADGSILVDPRSIVGHWRQSRNGAVEGEYLHLADGTIRVSEGGQKLGDWMQLGSKVVQRWPNGQAPSYGAWIFQGEISADGSRIEGTNQVPGQHFVLDRIGD